MALQRVTTATAIIKIEAEKRLTRYFLIIVEIIVCKKFVVYGKVTKFVKNIKTILKIKMRTNYKRILLKLSGESLMGEQGYGIDPKRVGEYAEQIKELAAN